MLLADIEHREAPLFHPSRHEPIGISGDQQPNVIGDLDRFLALELDEVKIARDEILNLAFGGMVAGPKAFVCVQQQGRDEMRIEARGDIARVGDGDVLFA